MSGWGPPLRIARRELLRAKARTLLVLLMVLVPVTAVVALSTLLRTSEIDVAEGLPRNLGEASARIEVTTGRVQQDPLLRSSGQFDSQPLPTAADLLAELPAGSRLLEVRDTYQQTPVTVDGQRRRVSLVGVDLRDPGVRGPYVVLEGRPPALDDEVAVSPDLARAGLEVGSTVELPAGLRTVTAVVQGPSDYGSTRQVLGPMGALGLRSDLQPNRYYSSGPPVEWDDVQRLNAIGALVLSRDVVLDPPPDDQVSDDLGVGSDQRVTLAVIGLISVMAVLEVVLLAGPAFAVGARRQRRALALLAATGGEPAHVRRVVLSQGLLVGVLAAVVGVPLGLAVAALARAPLTRWAGADWGPFDVGLLDVVLVALLGAATALLAALAPAVVMARQPVVAALQGRRVTSAGAGRPALLGLVLLGIGLAITVWSLSDGRFAFGGYSELGVAAGAIPTVLGAVLLAPAALALVGRAGRRLPLALRFAVRDADRQRGRTAPAVAAIAATVAGVVALGIASSSDAEQQRLTYSPQGPPGVGVVVGDDQTQWEDLTAAARSALPDERVRPVSGLSSYRDAGPDGYVETQLCLADERPQDGRCFDLVTDYGGSLGSDLLVGQQALEQLDDQLQAGRLRQAREVLAEGGVLVASPVLEPGAEVELRTTRFAVGPDGVEQAEVLQSARATAAPLPVQPGQQSRVRAVVSQEVAEQLGGARTVGLLVGEDLSRGQQEALEDAVLAADDGAYVAVERGYDRSADRTVLLVLSLVAGALVLGGTLAATALALSEARPDLATLGQVGARPRTRRAVAAGYALVLGLVGAVLGVLAGLVPGVAAAVPLTRGFASSGVYGAPAPPDVVIDVPWGLLALVLVVLPLVSALVAGLAVRSRVDGPGRAVA